MQPPHIAAPEGIEGVLLFRRRIPGFDAGKGQKIEETASVDGRIGPIDEVYRRLSPAFIGIILNVVMNKTGIMGKFYQRRQGKGPVAPAEAFAYQDHEQGAPALAPSAEKVPRGPGQKRKGFRRKGGASLNGEIPGGEEGPGRPVRVRLFGQGLPQNRFYLFKPQAILLIHNKVFYIRNAPEERAEKGPGYDKIRKTGFLGPKSPTGGIPRPFDI
jgi:hypothetical protein